VSWRAPAKSTSRRSKTLAHNHNAQANVSAQDKSPAAGAAGL
jgi:hypothetical protein